MSKEMERDIEDEKEIKIELFDSWPTYTAIPIPDNQRNFFPGYKEEFILETDIGEIKTWVTSAPEGTKKGANKGKYISKGIYKWQEEHPRVRGGDIVIMKKINENRYKLKTPD